MLGALTRRQSESEQQGGDKSKLFSSYTDFFLLSRVSFLIYNVKLCQGQCVVNVNYHRLTQFPASRSVRFVWKFHSFFARDFFRFFFLRFFSVCGL